MGKNEWKSKFADLVPLYEAGAYTSYEFSWFALPFFDGGPEDQELWDALPQDVKDCFVIQLGKDITMNDSTGMVLAERLAAVRRVAVR